MYKIESNIPMPNTYPFADMNVGDSFYVEGDKKAITNVRVAANTYKKKTGCKFKPRQMPLVSVSGWWRSHELRRC